MHQKRMCEYFGLPCRHTKTFLHLPPSVRRRIYLYAGLPAGQNILLRRRPPHDPYRWQFHQPAVSRDDGLVDEDGAFSLAMKLLQTNPEMHADVLNALCSVNRFIVCHDQVQPGLEFLRRLPPEACSELRGIYVHLYLKDPPGGRHGSWSSFQQRTLREPQIVAWQKAVSHVLSHATPGKLKLHLICDTGMSEVTNRVLQPLLDHAGVLEECHLRLSLDWNRRLREFAKSVSLRSTGLYRESGEKPFMFMHLPPELRHKILQYTDLVTPMNEVQWSQRKGFHVDFGPRYRQGDVQTDWGDVEPWDPHPWVFTTCETHWADEIGYFCSRDSGSYSPACRCWQPPRPLLLVSRAMYHESVAVLYSYNRIIVFDTNHGTKLLPDGDGDLKDHHENPWRNTTRHPVSRFLTGHTYPTALSHIRHLEVVMPAWAFPLPSQLMGPTHPSPDPTGSDNSDRYSRPESPSLSLLDWTFAVDHLHNQRLATNRAANELTITVHMYLTPTPEGLNRARRHPSTKPPPYPPRLQQQHAQFLVPLQRLRRKEGTGKGGLSRLFVFIDREWTWWRPPPPLLRSRAEESGVYDAPCIYDVDNDDGFFKLYNHWEIMMSGIETWSREWRSVLDGMEGYLEKEIMGEEYDNNNNNNNDDKNSRGAPVRKKPGGGKTSYWPSQWTIIESMAEEHSIGILRSFREDW